MGTHTSTEASPPDTRLETAVAHVSHELRTPLVGVLGVLQSLEATDLDAAQRELVRMATASSRHLLEVIAATLEHAKLSAGHLSIERAPLCLRDCIQQALDVVRHPACARAVAIEANVDADVPAWVVGDGVRIRQVLVNLLGNAIKFTREQTSVRLLVSRRGPTTVAIAVQDEGPGVRAEDRARLFEPFWQGDTRARASGTGLGLALSRTLCERMGGQLELEPSTRGARFVMTFHAPAVRAPAASAPRSAPYALPRPRGVLLAEDDLASQLVLRRLLESLGHDVRCVSRGAAALEALASDRVDVALIDVELPDMSGAEVVRRAREAGSRAHVIAISAHVDARVRDRCLDAGVDDLAQKPLDLAALRTRFDAIALHDEH